MSSLPSGTVTFLFTDIEGSTKLARAHPETWESARTRHHAILKSAIESNNGHIFQIIGDAFCATFHKAGDSLKAAIKAQQDLQTEPWEDVTIRVRMGIHTGEAEVQEDGQYHGYLTLSLVQRIMSAGHGNQTLLSGTTENLLRGQLPEGVELLDMGRHNFKDVTQAVRIFQVNGPNLQYDFLPLCTFDILPNNLPTQLTSFIGREKELEDVKRLLKHTHLLTLIGPGGTGKTRLSIQAAKDVLAQYPDGVWLVDLAPILDPTLVPRITAITIGLRNEPQRPVIDMLCDYLTRKKMLIILDNCEHLVDACAQMSDRILHVAADVQILASSREALGITGEVNYRVPSLGLPDLDNLPSLESMSQYEAVKLFTDRATAAILDFKVTNENAPALAQICHRLDGIPLAIELAAAKIRVLSVEQIAQRLNDRFKLLTGGSRTSLERHQTLRATVDWSYNLLPPEEQILLRRLSVFVGGWTLEAAESVCNGDAKDNTLNLLEQLINKSLVLREEKHGASRYRMLETMRQYSNEKLVESGESDKIRDDHLEFFLNLAETAMPHLHRLEQIGWLDQIDAEIENMRVALTRAIDNPTAEIALRLTGALGLYWNIRSILIEGSNWLNQALDKTWDKNQKSDKTARAKALCQMADIADSMDEINVMKTSAESALALYKELEDIRGVSYANVLVASYLRRAGDFAEASSFIEQSLTNFRNLGDIWGESLALYWQIKILRHANKRKEYLENRQELIAKLRASGDRYLLADTLVFEYGIRLIAEGELEDAERKLMEAQKLYTELGSSNLFNLTRYYLAQVYFLRKNFEEAKREAGLSLEHCHRIGEKNTQAFVLMFLGLIAEIEGNFQNAIKYQRSFLDLMIEIGDSNSIAWGQALLGRLNYFEDNHDVAMIHIHNAIEYMRINVVRMRSPHYIFVQLAGLFINKKPQTTIRVLGFTQTLYQNRYYPRDPIFGKPYFELFLSAAQVQLSNTEFQSLWEAGQKISHYEALELIELSILEKF